MRAKRPFILMAVCGTLLGAAACNGGSVTGTDDMQVPDTIVRDTSAMAPPSPIPGNF